VDPELHSISAVIARADARVKAGDTSTRVWPTGFGLLDEVLDGGFRSGNLILLAGPQGQGKTTLALQVARNAARDGRAVVYFCFEHDPEVLLERLIALEAGELVDGNGPSQTKIRRAFEARAPTPGGLMDRLSDVAYAADALERVRKYDELLHIYRSTGTATTVGVIASAIDDVRSATGQAPMVIVDYLQKVKVIDGSMVEDERVTIVVEQLKDLAIENGVPVVAIAAADKAGLNAGLRMRAQHMRGSTALAYEADVLLILSSKYDLVARQHLVFGVGNAERFRQWAILTVEKTRNGRAGIDLEYRQRFDQTRFDPAGRAVHEQLIDERLVLVSLDLE
jgi:replicative DNA helicase